MSGANAISGVIIIGGIILVGHADLASLGEGSNLLNLILGIFALLFVILITGSITFIIYNQNKVISAQLILKENELLKNKMSELSGDIDSILVKLKLMEEWEDDWKLYQNSLLLKLN